jgi:peptide-methionine (S)-S-oxide reductase
MTTKTVLTVVGAVAVVTTIALLFRPPVSDAAPLRAEASTDNAHTAVTRTAVFAGGCFWCMEPPFEKLDGVSSVVSGYIGGSVRNPSYEQVSAGRTGHTEAVEITYDPAKVTYAQLLDIFWHNIDPLTANAQFCDYGSQYRSEIFPANAAERAAAEASKSAIAAKLKRPIVTEITDATTFYAAEEYHQDYYKKNPIRYKFYRTSCGRDARLKELWGDAAGIGTTGLLKAN